MSQQEFEAAARSIREAQARLSREAAERVVRAQGGSVERIEAMFEAARMAKAIAAAASAK